MKNNLITPNESGILQINKKGGVFYLPLASYWEEDNKKLKDIIFLDTDITKYKDYNKCLQNSILASSEFSKVLSKKIFLNKDIENSVIYYDFTRFFIEIFIDRGIRAHIAKKENNYDLYPNKVNYTFNIPNNYNEFSRCFGYLNQTFQWSIFRILFGSSDSIKFKKNKIFTYKNINIYTRLILKFFINKYKFKKSSYKKIYYRNTLARFKILEKLNTKFEDIPNFISRFFHIKKNRLLRKEIKQDFSIILNKYFHNLKIDKESINNFSTIFSELISPEIIEKANINFKKYNDFVIKNNVSAVLSTGAYSFASIDENFFLAACRNNKVESITFQHGGMIGYEKSMPSYVTPMIYSDKYLSAGWNSYPVEYSKKQIKAEIVPLPNPYFSEISKINKNSGNKLIDKKILLVPISKLVTLDDKLGNNINSSKVLRLREFIINTVKKVDIYFDEIIFIYRSKNFNNDKIYDFANSNKKYHLDSNKNKKIYDYFSYVDAVLWDVTSTGFIESLSFGLPTVALNAEERWSKTSLGYIRYLKENNIIVEDSHEAYSALKNFTLNTNNWKKSLKNSKPFIEMYANTDHNWIKIWDDYFSVIIKNK